MRAHAHLALDGAAVVVQARLLGKEGSERLVRHAKELCREPRASLLRLDLKAHDLVGIDLVASNAGVDVGLAVGVVAQTVESHVCLVQKLQVGEKVRRRGAHAPLVRRKLCGECLGVLELALEVLVVRAHGREVPAVLLGNLVARLVLHTCSLGWSVFRLPHGTRCNALRYARPARRLCASGELRHGLTHHVAFHGMEQLVEPEPLPELRRIVQRVDAQRVGVVAVGWLRTVVATGEERVMATHQARGRGVLALYHPSEALVGGVLREFGDARGDVAGAPVDPGKAAHGNGVDVVKDHGQRGRSSGNARDLEGK